MERKMKISIGRTFDSGQVLASLSKSNVKGLDDFITYLQDMSTQLVNALRGTLTFEDNFNSTVKVIALEHNTSLTFQLPDGRKSPQHIIVTRTGNFTYPLSSFVWQLTDKGDVQVKATFTGTPTQAIDVTLVILY